MTRSDSLPPERIAWVVGAISIALAYSTVSGALVRSALHGFSVPSIPYFRSMVATVSDVLLMIGLVTLAARRSPLSLLRLNGLHAPIALPLRWSLLWFLPAMVACLVVAQPASDVRLWDVAWQAIAAPFFEEWMYRGLAVGLLIRLCGWSFWPACLWPALFFAAAHFLQGDDLASIAGIVLITGTGGLLFGWLFVRWNFNLWPAILLHIGMNGLWLVFGLGDNAIGGWFGNGQRLAVVLIAIVGSVWLAPQVKATERARTAATPQPGA